MPGENVLGNALKHNTKREKGKNWTERSIKVKGNAGEALAFPGVNSSYNSLSEWS